MHAVSGKLLLGAFALAPASLLACSAVFAVVDGKVVLGHNNDNSSAREWKVWFTLGRDGNPAAGIIPLLKEMSIRGRYKGEEVGTVESAVFDVTSGKAYLYFHRDFDHPKVYSLTEELAKGARTQTFRELFPNPVPFEPGFRYENGPVAGKPSPSSVISGCERDRPEREPRATLPAVAK